MAFPEDYAGEPRGATFPRYALRVYRGGALAVACLQSRLVRLELWDLGWVGLVEVYPCISHFQHPQKDKKQILQAPTDL